MYKLKGELVLRLADGACIPFANGNRDYEEYKQWLTEGNVPEPEFTDAELLTNAKDAKRQEIRNAFEVESIKPVTVGAVSYHGGFDSAIKLDAAKRLAEAAGATGVMFFDVANVGHVLTFTEAQTVVTSVAAKYQDDFANKQVKMVMIDDAITIDDVGVITWL